MTVLRGATASAWAGWRLLPQLAWRNLVPGRGRGGGGTGAYLVGSVVGIGLSLVPLIMVLEVSDGLIEGITRRYLEVATYHLQVGLPFGAERDRARRARLFDDLAQRLEQRLGGGTLAVRERQGTALAAAGGRRAVVTVRAVPTDQYRRDPGLRRYLEVAAGAFDLDGRGIVLAREVAHELDAAVGDRIVVVTALERGSSALVPKATPLEVRGIVASGYQELDKLWVYVGHHTGDRLLPPGTGREFVGVKIADPFADLAAVAARVGAIAGAGHPILTWEQLEHATYESFATSRALLLLIMSLIVAVAAANVASATVTVALARRREVAFLKSQGLPPPVVFWSLTLTGMLAGTLGAVLGIAGGLAAALNVNEIVSGLEALATLVRDALAPGAGLPAAGVAAAAAGRVVLIDRGFYLEHIPIEVEVAQLWIVAAATIALAALAASIPAARAARRRPVEVLRRTLPAGLDQPTA